MNDTRVEPAVRVATTPPSDAATELLVVPVFENDDLAEPDFSGLDAAARGEVKRALAQQEFKPTLNELFVTPLSGGGWQARRAALVGVGPGGDGAADRLRTAMATLAREARRRRVGDLSVVLRGAASPEAEAQAVAEGIVLGAFDDRRYRTSDSNEGQAHKLRTCLVLAPGEDQRAIEEAVHKGVVLATSTNLARELSNQPANLLTPTIFGNRSWEIVSPYGVDIDILEEKAIQDLGMGMLLGVARGSVEPPRVIVMRHAPADAPEGPVLGLVGKGVTFDSGGISIKPADGMDLMKQDMAGGAAVVCAMRAIGALRLPVRVVGVVPMTENMPGGRATKPGDVLTGASGTTVEVLNTDAEGRLILADALWYVRKLGATHLVDVATLTGACVVALGNAASGLFGHPQSWADTVQHAAERAGERVWQLPLYEDYREQLKSEIADLVNTGGRAGGACTAASFIGSFAQGSPWAHVDIAGTAWLDKASPDMTKGATGVMVRTLTELAAASATWSAPCPKAKCR